MIKPPIMSNVHCDLQVKGCASRLTNGEVMDELNLNKSIVHCFF